MSRTIKNDEIQNQIINRARQNGTPVLLIDSDTRPEGTIQISFDESDALAVWCAKYILEEKWGKKQN